MHVTLDETVGYVAVKSDVIFEALCEIVERYCC